MLVPLHDDKFIAHHVLCRHIPGFTTAVFYAAQPDALALTYGVEGKSDVLANYLPPGGFHRTRRLGQIAVKKLAKRPLTDETNTCRIFFCKVVQARLLGDAAHFCFLNLAERKQRTRQLRLVEAVQEITLVFAAVGGLEQLKSAVTGALAYARVVAGGDAAAAQRHGVLKKGLELDLGVTEHIWVGGAPGGVFA